MNPEKTHFLLIDGMRWDIWGYCRDELLNALKESTRLWALRELRNHYITGVEDIEKDLIEKVVDLYRIAPPTYSGM